MRGDIEPGYRVLLSVTGPTEPFAVATVEKPFGEAAGRAALAPSSWFHPVRGAMFIAPDLYPFQRCSEGRNST